MEQNRNLEEDLMLIDPQSRELIIERACVALSRCLRKKGFVPIYHCLQAEGTGPTLKFAMSCYLHGFLTTDRVLHFFSGQLLKTTYFLKIR